MPIPVYLFLNLRYFIVNILVFHARFIGFYFNGLAEIFEGKRIDGIDYSAITFVEHERFKLTEIDDLTAELDAEAVIDPPPPEEDNPPKGKGKAKA